jgi:dTDP-4-dehydrorhamnose reductase
MKVLLLGMDGQVGHEIRAQLGQTLDLVAVGRSGLDLSQPAAIAPLVASVQPAVIINAAAYTGVDSAETNQALAHQVNAIAPGELAQAASQVGAALIHISTDYVFDGRQSTPYQEVDPPRPLGQYGQSKLAGEQAVQAHCPRHVILRTAWVYGSQGRGNFVKTMVRLGAQRPELRVVYDQVGTPTWSQDLARVIHQFVHQLGTDPWGIYHYTNSGVTSWYDFALAIFAEAAALGYPLQVQRVVPIRTIEYPTPAPRPSFSVLATEKVTDFLGHRPPHWRQSLRTMLAEYVPLATSNYESTDSIGG